MMLRLTTFAIVTALTATTSLAQTGTVGEIGTEKEAKALIGAPLDTSASGGSAEPQNETLFFLEGNTVKPSGEWTEADRKACSDAGGTELPLPAGRIACIRL